MYVDSNFTRYTCADCTHENKKQINVYVKHYLIETGLYDLYLCSQKASYYYSLRKLFLSDAPLTETEKSYNFDFIVKQCSRYSWYHDIDIGFTDFEKKCCVQIFNNKRKRVQRLRNKLKNLIIKYDCLFLTLTFTDKVLSTTNEKTRRVYISRFLKGLSVPFYVANIDYGDLNEREHYHAIVQSDFIDSSLYKYGFIKVERIKKSSLSVVKISTYINKLSSHAFKDSTGQCRLIYSKPVHVSKVKLFKDKRISNNKLQISL